MTNLPFLIPHSYVGLPMSNTDGLVSGYNDVLDTLNGGDTLTNWVMNYGGVQQLTDSLPSNTPVQSNSEYGDYFHQTTVGDLTISIQSNTTLNTDVVENGATPETYQYNGQTYNIVGSVENTIAFNGVSAWNVELPLMLLSSVPMATLGKVGYSAFLKPIVSKVYQSIKAALSTEVEDGMDDVAISSAADIAAESADVTDMVLDEAAIDATLSLETGGLAVVGFVALIVVQVGIMLIIHQSYHNLIIYNFTDYNLTWGDAELKHDAVITMQPYTDTTGDTPEKTLPAMTNTSPNSHIATVPSAYMAIFNVYSDSEMYGCKWGLSFTLTDPVTNEAVTNPIGAMWDIPLAAKNSIDVAENVSQSDLSDWVKKEESNHKVYRRDIDLDLVTVTNTIDHLDDKHPVSLGSTDTEYIYRSVLVFQQAT